MFGVFVLGIQPRAFFLPASATPCISALLVFWHYYAVLGQPSGDYPMMPNYTTNHRVHHESALGISVDAAAAAEQFTATATIKSKT
jgi:hypothetical protein